MKNCVCNRDKITLTCAIVKTEYLKTELAHSCVILPLRLSPNTNRLNVLHIIFMNDIQRKKCKFEAHFIAWSAKIDALNWMVYGCKTNCVTNRFNCNLIKCTTIKLENMTCRTVGQLHRHIQICASNASLRPWVVDVGDINKNEIITLSTM